MNQVQPIDKVLAYVHTARPATRFWYDIVVTFTMILLLQDSSTPLYLSCLIVLVPVLLHAGSTFFNDMVDIEVDKSSTEKSRLQRASIMGLLTHQELTFMGILLTTCGVLITLTLPRPTIWVIFVTLLLALAYNFKPFYLSSRPFITQIFWPLMWILHYAFVAMALESSRSMIALPYLVFVVVFMGLGESLAQDIRDYDNDKTGGRTTTVVYYGLALSTWASFAFHVISVFIWMWFLISYVIPPLIGLVSIGILGYWIYVYAGIARRMPVAEKAKDRWLTHVGSIRVFTTLNFLVIFAVFIS